MAATPGKRATFADDFTKAGQNVVQILQCHAKDSMPAAGKRGKDTSARKRDLLADAVFLDLVLKGAEADPQQFGRALAMIGNFGKGSPDRFTLNILQG
jgi:hypothetical protein